MITSKQEFKPWELMLIDRMYDEPDDQYISSKKIIVSDCDGVLTDGNHVYTRQGKTAKIFGSCDKEALKFMMKCGWSFVFVTEDPTGIEITEERLRDWKITSYYSLPQLVLDVDNGVPKFCNANPEERKLLLEKLKSDGFYTVYIGDSNSDAWVGSEANLFCTPANSTDLAIENSKFTSKRDGGHGAFAEILYEVYNITVSNKDLFV